MPRRNEEAPQGAIEVVLQVPPQSMPAVQLLVGERQGIEIAVGTFADLLRRTDMDALVLAGRVAAENYLAKMPRAIVEVVIDPATDTHVRLYETTISPANTVGASKTAASWIVVIGNYAPQTDERPLTKELLNAPLPIQFSESSYPKFLNALSVIKRHNRSGPRPPIRRLAMMMDEILLPSLLRAYDEYEQ